MGSAGQVAISMRQPRLISCRLRWALSVELALSSETSDPSIELGLLLRVDPARRYPFRQPVAADATAPAILQEMGVVITAEQGQVVKISWSAINPIQDVMSVAPLRWMITAGERTPAFPGDQGHCLTAGSDASGSSLRLRGLRCGR